MCHDWNANVANSAVTMYTHLFIQYNLGGGYAYATPRRRSMSKTVGSGLGISWLSMSLTRSVVEVLLANSMPVMMAELIKLTVVTDNIFQMHATTCGDHEHLCNKLCFSLKDQHTTMICAAISTTNTMMSKHGRCICDASWYVPLASTLMATAFTPFLRKHCSRAQEQASKQHCSIEAIAIVTAARAAVGNTLHRTTMCYSPVLNRIFPRSVLNTRSRYAMDEWECLGVIQIGSHDDSSQSHDASAVLEEGVAPCSTSIIPYDGDGCEYGSLHDLPSSISAISSVGQKRFAQRSWPLTLHARQPKTLHHLNMQLNVAEDVLEAHKLETTLCNMTGARQQKVAGRSHDIPEQRAICQLELSATLSSQLAGGQEKKQAAAAYDCSLAVRHVQLNCFQDLYTLSASRLRLDGAAAACQHDYQTRRAQSRDHLCCL